MKNRQQQDGLINRLPHTVGANAEFSNLQELVHEAIDVKFQRAEWLNTI
jgi:hypothetical protein